MVFRHAKSTGIVLGGFNASPFFNSFDTGRSLSVHDVTAFESESKSYAAGIQEGTLSLSGFYDVGPAGTSADELLETLRTLEADFPATVALDGGLVVGRNARIANVLSSGYTINSPTADMVSSKAEFVVDGGARFAKILSAKQPITATYTGAAADYGTTDWLTSSNGYATIHPIANTRSTATEVKIQQSADNSVWVDHATVSIPAGSTTGIYAATTGANLRYVRALITPAAGTGSATIVVAFARA